MSKKVFITGIIAVILTAAVIFSAIYLKNEISKETAALPASEESDQSISSDMASENEWLDDYTAEPGDYAMIAVPDIQELTAYYPDKLTAMFQWISDNKETENIKFVIGLGDLTFNGCSGTTNNQAADEFSRAAAAYKILENAGIYYSNVYGNRDYVASSPRNTDLLNTYFPWSEYSKWPCYGGAMEANKSDNLYYCFTAGTVKYLVIALEYEPDAAVLDWANTVAEEHPDYNIIVSTHSYLGMDGNRFDTTAEKIWTDFVSKHKNIFLVLCGHVTNDNDPGSPVYSVDYGVNGNKVNQLLIDAQDIDSERGGVGMLMIMRFTDMGKTINFNYYSPIQKASFKEINQFTIKINDDQIIYADPD